jgi:hypothetical protein
VSAEIPGHGRTLYEEGLEVAVDGQEQRTAAERAMHCKELVFGAALRESFHDSIKDSVPHFIFVARRGLRHSRSGVLGGTEYGA